MIYFASYDPQEFDYASLDWRAIDKQECAYFMPDKSVPEAIKESAMNSEDNWTLTTGDVVLGVGGISNHPDFVGHIIWFVGTNLIHTSRYRRQVWAAFKKHLELKMAKYQRLSNFCLSHPSHIRMLEKLGFKAYETVDSNVRYIECVL